MDGMDIQVPIPCTRKEYYLAKLCGMDVPVPTPVTQDEMYLYALCGYTVDVPLPVTRLQVFMAAKLGMNVPTLSPVTKEEYYWSQYEPTPPYVIETVTGVAPLLLAGAVADQIVSLTQTGKCTQASTPTPDAPVDIVCNNGALKFGKPLTIDSTRIEAYIDTNGLWAKSDVSYSVCVPVEIGKKYAIRMTDTTSGTVGTILRFGFAERNTAGNTSTDPVQLTQWVRSTPQDTPFTELVADKPYLVVQMTSSVFADNIANGYVLVTEQKLWADGTPETLTVSGNIVEFNETRIDSTTWASADKSHGFEVRADVYNKSVGNSLFSNSNSYGAFVPCAVGQSVSINFFNYEPYYGRCYYCEVTADGTCNTDPVKFSTNTAVSQQTFTLTQADSIGFVIEWYISTTERDYTKENYAVCYGTTPLSAYQPYTPIQTVTGISNLLAVGDIADTQEIIEGIKTGKVGVKVLDGTESWARDAADISINKTVLFGWSVPADSAFLMTHFSNTYGNTGFRFGNGAFYTKNTLWATVGDFTSFLAAQYAAGTPVIILYPLDTETTEQTTAHALTTADGTNTVDAVTNVGAVTLTAEYKATA